MSNQLWPRGRRRCCQRLACCLEPGFFRALGDNNRLALLVQLAGCRKPCTVSELAVCCPVDLSVVSRHLATLRDAGLVVAAKRGKEVYYSVLHGAVADTLRSIADAIDDCGE